MAPYLTHVRTPRGTWGDIAIRDGTSDMSLVLGTFSNQFHAGHDEYELLDLVTDGPFVDVGAHIGTVALAVLLDNPSATAILVEPFAENVAMCRQTLEANGLTDRAVVVKGAVGTNVIRYGTTEDDRYIGNIGTHRGKTIRTRLLSLAQLVKMAGGAIDVLKLDCEGGEWSFLASPALRDVRMVLGEWHGHVEGSGPDALRRLLEPTHEVTKLTDDGGIGLFRAVRR